MPGKHVHFSSDTFPSTPPTPSDDEVEDAGGSKFSDNLLDLFSHDSKEEKAYRDPPGRVEGNRMPSRPSTGSADYREDHTRRSQVIMPAKTPTVRKPTAATTSGTATHVITKDISESSVTLAGGKPDKKAYEEEQAKIKTEINALQAQLSIIRDKIGFAAKSGSGNDRRMVLRAELDSIRDQQSANKHSRGKLLDQIKAIENGIQKRTSDLEVSKSTIPFKSVAEIDARIENLERQIESGNMRIVDEKRALQEITSCKRSRRTVEGFEAEDVFIKAERKKVAELRAQLDDPPSKQAAERYDSIKAELDELRKESEETYTGRSKLFEERDNIQNQLQAAFNRKRESSQLFREANDHHWTKINDDRARRAEKARTQRAAEELRKKQEIAKRLREDAQLPAFQAQIEDCQTLIDYFSGRSIGNITYKSTPLSVNPEITGVPKLELRKVEEPPKGWVVQKKKKGEEDAYFISSKKDKAKKGSSKAGIATPATPIANASTSLNVPLPTLSALLSLSIPPPASNLDLPRVIEDLNTKKVWFEANQARVTAENIAKAEADIQHLTSLNVVGTHGSSQLQVEASVKSSLDQPQHALGAGGPGTHIQEIVDFQQMQQNYEKLMKYTLKTIPDGSGQFQIKAPIQSSFDIPDIPPDPLCHDIPLYPLSSFEPIPEVVPNPVVHDIDLFLVEFLTGSIPDTTEPGAQIDLELHAKLETSSD